MSKVIVKERNARSWKFRICLYISDFENFTHENMIEVTDPSLLQGDYVQRMNLMDSINQRLLEKIEIKKQRLALLRSKEREQRDSGSPRRSGRNKRVNQDGDYEYY